MDERTFLSYSRRSLANFFTLCCNFSRAYLPIAGWVSVRALSVRFISRLSSQTRRAFSISSHCDESKGLTTQLLAPLAETCARLFRDRLYPPIFTWAAPTADAYNRPNLIVDSCSR